MSEAQPPDYDDEDCDNGILIDSDEPSILMDDNVQQSYDALQQFFANARDF